MAPPLNVPAPSLYLETNTPPPVALASADLNDSSGAPGVVVPIPMLLLASVTTESPSVPLGPFVHLVSCPVVPEPPIRGCAESLEAVVAVSAAVLSPPDLFGL